MKRSIVLLAAFAAFLCSWFYGQPYSTWAEEQEKEGDNSFRLAVSVEIAKQSFFLDEPVIANVTVRNIDPTKQSVSLNLKKENFFESLFLELYDEDNNKVKPSITYLSWLNEKNKTSSDNYLYDFSKQIEEKKIELDYGETFSTEIDLKNFFEITEASRYFLSGYFIINIDLSSTVKTQLRYPMNRVSFQITEAGAPPAEQDQKRSSLLSLNQKDGTLMPSQVVQKFFDSQKNMQWDRHFSTLHLLSFLKNSYSKTEVYERFISADQNQVDIILRDFQDALIKSYDYEILDYAIERAVVDPDSAKVFTSATLKRKVKRWMQIYSPLTEQINEGWAELGNAFITDKVTFIFDLKKFENTWLIVRKNVSMRSFDKDNMITTETSTLDDTTVFGYLYFQLGKYDLTEDHKKTLKKLVNYLLMNPRWNLEINGFADPTGIFKSNLLLSRARAIKARLYIVNELGFDANRITLNWYGSEKPISMDNALNRRVELKVVSPEN